MQKPKMSVNFPKKKRTPQSLHGPWAVVWQGQSLLYWYVHCEWRFNSGTFR